MPPRPYTILILLFWVGMTSWLFYSDLWPRLQPGEPPPFAIDLADEASAGVQKTYWTLFRDGVEIGSVETWIKYHSEDDTFEIPSILKFWFPQKKMDATPLLEMDSMYRITREGELRQIAADVRVPPMVSVHLDGAMRDKRFLMHFQIQAPNIDIKQDLKPIEVSRGGNMFNPRQPMNKIRGVRPGQRWRMPLMDPVTDALKAAASQALPLWHAPEFPTLQAEVLPTVQELPRLIVKPINANQSPKPRRAGIPCLVIQYTGEDLSARIWVREQDGLVLRQEVTQHGDTWILDRDELPHP